MDAAAAASAAVMSATMARNRGGTLRRKEVGSLRACDTQRSRGILGENEHALCSFSRRVLVKMKDGDEV